MRGLLLNLCAVFIATGAHAIEAPRQQSDASSAEQSFAASVSPTDETQFYEQLQRVTHWRNLRGLHVPQDAIDELARGNADVAVAALSEAAAKGNEEANIALVRIQHWCSRVGSARPPNLDEQIAQLSNILPPERAARAAGVLQAEAAFMPRAAQGCRRANFDYGAIEDRLREAADAGRPASATELAQFTRDRNKRDALLEAAAKQGYAPAMYAIATRRVVDVQRAERTEDVASIRLYLKQAGTTMPKAKVDLANCMALGCDGHPADASSARAFGIDAARDGEPTAFLSMARMPWGRRMSRAELIAWQYFGDRLNEAGCMGDAYIAHASGFAQAIEGLSRNADDRELDQAREQAERLWKDYSTRAMNEQGCSATAPRG
jgi:hypothetical protein